MMIDAQIHIKNLKNSNNELKSSKHNKKFQKEEGIQVILAHKVY